MRSPARPSVTGGDTPFMEWKASLAGQLQPLKRDFDRTRPGRARQGAGRPVVDADAGGVYGWGSEVR